MNDTIQMSERLQKALGSISDARKQAEYDRVAHRNIFMGAIVEGLAEKGNSGTFFEGNKEAATAHRVGLREGAAVVMSVIDRMDASLEIDEHCINLQANDDFTYTTVSMEAAFAASINS
jgi:hypothetical protein